MHWAVRAAVVLGFASATAFAQGELERAGPSASLTSGETFALESKAVNEVRHINVYRPPAYVDSPNTRLPVVYMPEGGRGEDLLHVAGLLQVSMGNGTMRRFLLAEHLGKSAPAILSVHYEPMPGETHATLYHPAALQAVRHVFKPRPDAHQDR